VLSGHGTIVELPSVLDSTFLRGEGRTIRITVWLATRDRPTWIAAVETLFIGLIVLAAPEMTLARVCGLALLAHLGYSAMTSLPVGQIPGRPRSMARERRNADLRTRVVGFLNEIRRVEAYAERARVAGLPASEVERTLHTAHERMMVAAAEVVKVTGRPVPANRVPPGTTLHA
jgi:hypothetical protein